MTFLPKNYKDEMPKGESLYMKFEEGENRFRVLDSAITGWELWIDGKPVRHKDKNEYTLQDYEGADINKFTGKKRLPTYFWAFPVWNYQEEKIQILEVTQATVMRGMQDFLDDDDYGDDPKEYDFVVVREDKEPVEYRVKAKPPKKLDEGIMKLYRDMDINLKALYTGDDPFSGGSEYVDPDEIDKVLGGK